MSLYNLMCGKNLFSELFLAMLDLTLGWPESVVKLSEEYGENAFTYEDKLNEEARQKFEQAFQECIGSRHFYIARFRDVWIEDEGKVIVIYARSGGGNRDWLWWIWKLLRQHPAYISDKDDDYDKTYATIRFKTPEEHLSAVQELVEIYSDSDKTGQQKMDESLEKLKAGDPEFLKRVKPVMDKLKEALESGKSGLIEI